MFKSLPPATRAIIVINVAVYFLQWYSGNRGVEDQFALWPLGTDFRPWQLITYAFLHGSPAHLFFNMLALFMFGKPLEEFWGTGKFIVFYTASVLAAAASQLAVTYVTHGVYPTVGASGGVFGVLLAFALTFPKQRIMLLIPPIPMPAWLFVTLYGCLELFLGVTGTQPGVAHFAHLGGMLGAALVIAWWRLTSSGRRI